MTDMESLDRAVEEARVRFVQYWNDDNSPLFEPDLDALIEAVSAKARAEDRERPEEWAGELCWHRGSHSFSPRCNQRRDHVVHDGVCHGCDVTPHEHHGFIPAQATDEYYEEPARSSEEAGNGSA